MAEPSLGGVPTRNDHARIQLRNFLSHPVISQAVGAAHNKGHCGELAALKREIEIATVDAIAAANDIRVESRCMLKKIRTLFDPSELACSHNDSRHIRLYESRDVGMCSGF